MTVTQAGPSRPRKKIPAFWLDDSTPFAADGTPAQPCRIVLRQVDDNDFELATALVFTPPDDIPDRPGAPLVIRPDWLTSDLASIPGMLGWFARRHGRHTPAALVHDFLITGKGDTPPPDLPKDWVVAPELADLLFRRMLLSSGVPPVRSYLMWSAVAARTRWNTGAPRKVQLVVWGLAAAAGTGLLVYGLAQQKWALVAVALAAPVPSALLWGRQFVAGVIAGYAVWWALVGSAPAWVAFKAYQGVEGVVWLARWLRHRRAGAPAAEAPPAPVAYDAR